MAFLLALAPHQLQLSGSLEDVSPCSHVGKWSLALEGAEQILSTNYFVCLFCLGLSEGLMQDTYLYFT